MNFLENPAYRGLGRDAAPLGLHERVLRSLHPADPPHLESQLGARRNGPLGLPPGERAAARRQRRPLLLRGPAPDGRRGWRWRAGRPAWARSVRGRRGPPRWYGAFIRSGSSRWPGSPVGPICSARPSCCSRRGSISARSRPRGPPAAASSGSPPITLAAALFSKGAALPFVGALFSSTSIRSAGSAGWAWGPWCARSSRCLLVTLAGAAAVVYAVRQGAVLTDVRARAPSPGSRRRPIASSWPRSAMIWPASLSPLYEMPARIDPLEPRFALALAGVVLVTAALVGLRARWPGGLAAWTFSVLMLAPTSAAVRQGADLAPDRYTYLSGMGFAAGPGRRRPGSDPARPAWNVDPLHGAVRRGRGPHRRRGPGLTSWSYGLVWRESETLWRWAIEVDPDCSVCHGKLGESALGGRGARRGRGGRRTCSAARSPCGRISPTRTTTSGRPSCSRDAMPTRRRRSAATWSARPGPPPVPERLGLVYLLQGRYEPAVPLLRTAFVLKADAPDLRRHLVAGP